MQIDVRGDGVLWEGYLLASDLRATPNPRGPYIGLAPPAEGAHRRLGAEPLGALGRAKWYRIQKQRGAVSEDAQVAYHYTSDCLTTSNPWDKSLY